MNKVENTRPSRPLSPPADLGFARMAPIPQSRTGRSSHCQVTLLLLSAQQFEGSRLILRFAIRGQGRAEFTLGRHERNGCEVSDKADS